MMLEQRLYERSTRIGSPTHHTWQSCSPKKQELAWLQVVTRSQNEQLRISADFCHLYVCAFTVQLYNANMNRCDEHVVRGTDNPQYHSEVKRSYTKVMNVDVVRTTNLPHYEYTGTISNTMDTLAYLEI